MLILMITELFLDSRRLSLDANEGTSANYMNVNRQDATNQQSEYYNVSRVSSVLF